MRCKSVLTRIDAMRTGELPDAESSAVHEHLKTCGSCDESVADLAELARSVKSLSTAPPRSLRGLDVDHFDIIENGGDRIFVAFSDRGLRMIHLSAAEEEFREIYAKRFARDLKRATLPERLRRQVIAALRGDGVDEPKIDWTDAGEFERAVLEVLKKIPAGEVRTY